MKRLRPRIVKMANAMIAMRPVGPRSSRTTRAFPGMRTLTSPFCKGFCSDLGTRSYSLMAVGPAILSPVAASSECNDRRQDRRSHFSRPHVTGAEMQAYAIARQIYCHEVAHVDAESSSRMEDQHVVGHDREIERMGFSQHLVAEVVIGSGGCGRGACQACHEALELVVAEVNRGEDREHGKE